MALAEDSFISHLVELRDRLIRALIAIAVAFALIGFWPTYGVIYDFLALPLIQTLPTGSKMIATGVITPFLIPLKVGLMAAFLLVLPYVLYQAWAFVAPGLYSHEKKLVLPLVVSSTVLFFIGVAFCYYFVFGQLFRFIAGFAPASIMGFTILQYAGVIGGNWFMRSRIDRTGAKPFFRFMFMLFALVAAGWLGCLRWPPLIQGVMPGLYFLLGAGTGMFTAANASYLAKILPEEERALPVAVHGALSYFIGGLSPVVWGLVLKGGGSMPTLNLAAFQWFFVVTLDGSVVLVMLVGRLVEKPGHVDPILEGSWFFRPFRVVTSLIMLAEPARPAAQKDENLR